MPRRSLAAVRSPPGRGASGRAGTVVTAGLLAALAIWLIGNLIQSPSQFGNVVLIGLENGSIYGLMALGYSLIYGILQLFNFPQGDIFTLAAFVGISLITGLLGTDGKGAPLAIVLVLILVLVVACIVSAGVNLAIEHLVYRPMRRRAATRIEPMIASFGCVYLLQNVIQVVWTTDHKAVPGIFPSGVVVDLGGVTIRWNDLLVFAVATTALLLLRWFIQRTRTGKALRAVAEDGEAAATLGIDAGRLISLAYIIGGLLLGTGAVLYLSQFGSVRYDSGFILGLFAFTAAILGGMGNLNGAIAGGLTIGLVQALNEGSSWLTPGPSWSPAIIFGILVIILTVRPQGLLGQRAASGNWTSSPTAAGRRRRRRRPSRLAAGVRALPRPALGTLAAGPLRGRPGKVVASLAVVVLLVLYPQYVTSLPTNLPVITSFPSMPTMVVMAVFALMAIGLNVVVGYAGLLDLGFVAFYATGAYVMAWLASAQFDGASIHLLQIGPAASGAGVHLTPWLVLIIAAVVSGAIGAAIGFPTLRLRGDYLAIVTFGFGEIIPVFILNGGQVTNGAFGISGIDSPGLGGLGPVFGTTGTFRETLDSATYFYWGALAVLLVGIIVSVNLRASRTGRAWIAVREDEDAAAAVGVPLMRVKTYAYMCGAAIGGVGGAYYATYKGTAFPSDFSFSFSFLILTMVILGGAGSVRGVALAGALLAWLDQEGLAGIGHWFTDTLGVNIDVTKYQLGLFGLLLIVMLVFRPQGLIPERRHAIEERERELLAVPGEGRLQVEAEVVG
jgi:branched-chain amino acid transport system permease protein